MKRLIPKILFLFLIIVVFKSNVNAEEVTVINEQFINCIPTMQSNTTPSGITFSSDYLNNEFTAYKAFDSDNNTCWKVDNSYGKIGYEFTNERVISAYAITAESNSAPKYWNFEAYDGNRWIVLDRQYGQRFDYGYNKKIYYIDNTKSYKKYRLNIERNSGSYYLAVNSLEMMENQFLNSATAEIETNSNYKIGEDIEAKVVIDNGINICAEDIIITYDPYLLEYNGYQEEYGQGVYSLTQSTTPGVIRIITASKGRENAINSRTAVINLRFKAKNNGKCSIDIKKARVANNGTIEGNIKEYNCYGAEVYIESCNDVDKSGEFTLLDLGIDAWYYGDYAYQTNTNKYNADVVPNGRIDSNDLLAIVDEMLNNSNYPGNH